MKISNIIRFYASPKRHVIQFSPVRTGSTLVYNLLRECLPDKTVTKVHTYSCHFSHLPIVATTRHPFDCIASIIQINKEAPDEKTIRAAVANYHANGGRDLLRIKNHRKLLLLRYEEFVDDYEPIFAGLESLFGLSIGPERRNELTQKYNIESARKIAAGQGEFAKWDPVTLLHGQHISKFGGRPSYHKDYFTETHLQLLRSLCQDDLTALDYQ